MTKPSLLPAALLLMLCGVTGTQTSATVLPSPSPQQAPHEKPAKAAAVDRDEIVRRPKLKFEGLHAIKEPDMLLIFREHRIEVSPELLSDSARAQRAVRVIKYQLAELGYLNATVDIVTEDPANLTAITFIVNEGERSRVAEIRFEGNRIFSTQQLIAQAEPCQVNASELREGYSFRAIESCLRAVRSFLGSKGYLNYTLGEPKRRQSKSGLKITIPLKEGARYRLGEIKIADPTLFSKEQIREMLPLKTGDIADTETINDWLDERLYNAYTDKGYVRYTFDVEPHFSPVNDEMRDGTVDLEIFIDEGRPFKIRSIKFKGSALMTDEELRGLLLIREGEIYSEQRLHDNLKKINDLGLFEELEWHMTARGGTSAGVQFSYNDETLELGITFTLQEKTAP
jgi:outer membrane protein insertion porin family